MYFPQTVNLILILTFIFYVHAAVQYYVNVKIGSDNNPGTQSQPFATIGKAQMVIRSMNGNLPAGGIMVMISEGDYYLNGPIAFTAADSGTAASPISYMGSGMNTRVMAGKRIPLSSFQKVGQNSSILKANLISLGISNFGEFVAQPGLGQCNVDKLEVFYNSEPMIIARYPNIAANGSWMWDSIAAVFANDKNSFQYTDTRTNTWVNEKDVWLHGYWSFDWADGYVRIDTIDTNAKVIHTDPATPPVYGFLKNARYYGLNIFRELDAPNEYYLNRTSGDLFIIPPKNPNSADEIMVSLLESVVTITNTKYLTLSNILFGYARTDGVIINSGSNIKISKCGSINNGRRGFNCNGNNIIIDSAVVRGTGCSGISISGGDINQLTLGNNLVSNSNITYYSRWIRTYNPGVSYYGVGNSIMNNYIAEAPHQGISGHGDYITIEGNHLKDLCYETDDAGAFYTGRSWIDRGNVLRNNIFENVVNTNPPHLGFPNVNCAYLDDQMSGWVIEGNTFIKCQWGVHLGGGRRNKISNNYFVDTELAIHFDNRGMTWQADICKPGAEFNQEMNTVHYQQPPWSVKFPELLTIFSDHPCVPVHNEISGNLYCNCGGFLDASDKDIDSWFSQEINNTKGCKKFNNVVMFE